MMWTVKLFVCWMALELSSGEEKIELEIAQGKLNGLKNITVYNSIPFYSFRGIPYAKPNIGRDRFNVAVPLENWSGVYDATKHGNFCLQLNGTEGIKGDDDCLFVNVYTPDLNKTAGRAVMVFIHGGAFLSSSGDDVLYGPDFLVEKDIVLVTMNYRLGVIGFLNTGDASAPGNIGLKDQNLALKWVQKNIIDFGGDPERVTIFGQSAGAASVHYHMMSPMSRGLFKGAILQSGAAVNTWDFSPYPQDKAMMIGNILGINVTDMATFVEELKDESPEDLIMASHKIDPVREIFFVPTIEIDVGQDVFFRDDPWRMLTSGEISDVPVMIGITEDEFGYWTPEIFSEYSQLKHPLDEVIPMDLELINYGRTNEITSILSKFYFNELPITLNPSAFKKLFNDAFANHGLLMSAEIINARISSPVYKYLFNHRTSKGFFKRRDSPGSGVVLYDDLELIFYSSVLNNLPEPGSLDAQKTDEMVEMWTNFAKEGNPSATMESAKVEWKPMNVSKHYLEIGTKLEMKTHLWQDRVELWAHLYGNVIGNYVKLFE